MARRPHLLAPNPATSRKYTGYGQVVPRKEYAKNRAAHGAQIRNRLLIAWQAKPERTSASVAGASGTYLEFEIDAGYDDALKSLESESRGIELVGLRVSAAGTSLATIYVPKECEAYFVRKVDDYLLKNNAPSVSNPNGSPRNQKLIESLADVRAPLFEALWTDDPAQMPVDDQPRWWELWLRIVSNEGIQAFRDRCHQLHLDLGARELRFVDRTVLIGSCRKSQLVAIFDQFDSLAEVRRAKEPPEQLIGLGPLDQVQLAQDLAQRVTAAQATAPAVCILDTGVNRGHPILSTSLAPADVHAIHEQWGTHDHQGHGTGMAGLALLADRIPDLLAGGDPVALQHRLESAKILPPQGENHPDLYGAIVQEGIKQAREQAPDRRRINCLAVTSDALDKGVPTSWSAAMDAASFDHKELMFISAGNVGTEDARHYPDRNVLAGVEDPAQAWNAITVGSSTRRVALVDPPGWTAVAPEGDLSPWSRTSVPWGTAPWPIKPEIVMEGGNAAIDLAHENVDEPDALSLVTTHHDLATRPFRAFNMTSASTALASELAATLHAGYPDYWAETVRGLMVHSAEWTPAMLARCPSGGRDRIELRLRTYGFGIPSHERARWSADNRLTLIAQETIQPFDGAKSNEMKLHRLPWPTAVLAGLGAAQVELRVTLSYFVEPNPGRRGWKYRHRYASHGLRFDVKTAVESVPEFEHRINAAAAAEDPDQSVADTSGDPQEWVLGPKLRGKGSIHSDRWRGNAADLASREYVGVFPVIGWWRERHQMGRSNQQVRYSLIVSISTPVETVDLYSAVAAEIQATVPIVA